MNFGRPDDPIALAAGISFTIAALLIVVYSGYNFMWRAFKIRSVMLSSARKSFADSHYRKRQAVNYQDPIGPPAICALLFASVVINFVRILSKSICRIPADLICTQAWRLSDPSHSK